MKIVPLIFAILLIGVSLVPVTHGISQDKNIEIVATLQIFASFASQIGGSYVHAEYIVPQGGDIHSYSLTYNDIEKLEGANLIILASSQFFSLDKNIKEKMIGKNILDFDDYHATLFPLGSLEKNVHGYWLYPPNAVNISIAIERKLAAMDPSHQQYYHHNLEKFLGNINHTVTTVREISKVFHLENKSALLAIPGAFYIPKFLEIHIVGTIVEGPNKFLSENSLKKIIEDIKSGKIDFIINAESLENSRAGQIAMQISSQTGVKILYIDIFSTGNYTSLLLKDTGILCGGNYVSIAYPSGGNPTPYVIIIGLISIVAAIAFVELYRCRRELTK